MIVKQVKAGLAVAALIIGVSLALLAGQKLELIGADASLRWSMALSGLILAYYANAVPKAVFRSARAAHVQRVAGWVFFVTGLLYAAAWAFAPTTLAFASTGLMAAGLVGVVFYCLWTRAAGAPKA